MATTLYQLAETFSANGAALQRMQSQGVKALQFSDEIWDALGLPGLPDLFSFDVATLIDNLTKALVEKRKKLFEKLKNAVGDAREEIKKQIEDINKSIVDALESISIGSFSLRSIIGGAIYRTVQSLEETVSEIKIASLVSTTTRLFKSIPTINLCSLLKKEFLVFSNTIFPSIKLPL